MELKKGGPDLKLAWELHAACPDKFAIFDPIFQKVLSIGDSAVLLLSDILEFLEKDLKLTVRRHPSLESAKEDIESCKLVFLDFFLYRKSTAAKAIEDVKAYNQLFASKVSHDGKQYDRLLFLVSSALPSSEDIEQFRRAATVKAAFFKPVPKQSLNRSWFTEEFSKQLKRYDDMHRMASYLDVFSDQMRRVSESLRDDLEALGLHDLTLLDHMRLRAEQEDLGVYMSWIMSEALADRLRASAPVLSASKEVNAVQPTPFHGMLSPNHVLFSWFSEIAFAIPLNHSGLLKVQFGDVFCPVIRPPTSRAFFISDLSPSEGYFWIFSAGPEDHAKAAKTYSYETESPLAIHFQNQFTPADKRAHDGAMVEANPNKSPTEPPESKELILVIAPACDLQRAVCSDEILCVRGTVIKKTPNLFDLIDQSAPLGKDQNSGGFKHLMKRADGDTVNYFLVEWYPANVTSMRVHELQSSSHVRLARLNEIFTQEVKEDALRQVGRVGVPVDPSVNIGLGATIIYSFKRLPPIEIEIPEAEIVSGLYSWGNANNRNRIILSEEFIDRFKQIIGELDPSKDARLVEIVPKLQAAYKYFQEKGGEGLKLTKNADPNSPITVQYQTSFARRTGRKGFCGVCFYPRGSITDPVEQQVS